MHPLGPLLLCVKTRQGCLLSPAAPTLLLWKKYALSLSSYEEPFRLALCPSPERSSPISKQTPNAGESSGVPLCGPSLSASATLLSKGTSPCFHPCIFFSHQHALTLGTSPASCFSSWLSLVVFLERVCVLMRASRSRRLSCSTLVYFKAVVRPKKRALQVTEADPGSEQHHILPTWNSAPPSYIQQNGKCWETQDSGPLCPRNDPG